MTNHWVQNRWQHLKREPQLAANTARLWHKVTVHEERRLATSTRHSGYKINLV